MSLKGSAKERNVIRGSVRALKTINGKSAYEIAVLEGFAGTQKEWLDSLKGKDGEDGVDGNVIVGDLPQKWFDINEAYEAIGESGHKLMGGLIYKDFDGNIKVYPLAPAYGVRTDECGEKLAAVVVYNSAQQIMVKPATDGRHTVSLRQLDEFFGGGSTSDLGEKAFSLQKIPPVDLTPPVNERKPYVFCRDSRNHFAPKYYSEPPFNDELAERDSVGRLRANAPDKGSTGLDDYVVNVDYLNRILNQKLSKYLPLSGGTMTGTHTIKRNNPCLKLTDTSDNTTAYVQIYQGLLRLGYTWQKSLTVDKDGNVGIYGSLSCNTPTEAEHAVTLGYLNNGVVADIADLTERLNALADSDDIDLDQLSEIVAYIKSNKSLIDGITTSKVSVSDIVDNLTSTATNKPLSAAQGVELKRLIDSITVPTKTEALTLTYEDGSTRTLEVYVK